MTDFYEIGTDGKLTVRFHKFQARAMKSLARFVAVIAGTQSGKTLMAAIWLYREIMAKGPGDYLVVSPTYKLMNLKALPEFLKYFKTMLGLGTYNKTDKVFRFSEAGELATFGSKQETPTIVYFGYAEDPDSLESSTAKAAWLDEAGQRKFKLDSWYAILRRLSIHQGRVLITTTPYDLGWLKVKIDDAAKAGDPDYEVIRFDSRANPVFPLEEWERAKRDLPSWKFDLMYRGIFTRPAGVIYDVFDAELDVVDPFAIPLGWQRFIGLDFGGVNTAALFYAREVGSPTLYLYREYKAGSKTAARHVASLLVPSKWDEFRHPDRCAGGSKSEDQWRAEFAAAGLGIEAPSFSDVEVGIDRVYGHHARHEIRVFSDCEGYLDEKSTYRRKLDKNDEPTEVIEDKETFHFMDAERYIISKLSDPQHDASMFAGAIDDMETRSTWEIE